MSKYCLMYIELKSGHQDNGPEWIGRVKLSQSGRTVYFNGRAFKRAVRGGIQGNHFDFETGEEYWLSGVKKDGTDRHWAGTGKIKIHAAVVDEYLALVGRKKLDLSRFEVVTDLVETDVERFRVVENQKTGMPDRNNLPLPSPPKSR